MGNGRTVRDGDYSGVSAFQGAVAEALGHGFLCSQPVYRVPCPVPVIGDFAES